MHISKVSIQMQALALAFRCFFPILSKQGSPNQHSHWSERQDWPFVESWRHSRWAPASYKWSYNPHKWQLKWVTGVITPINIFLTLLITGRGPSRYNQEMIPKNSSEIVENLWKTSKIMTLFQRMGSPNGNSWWFMYRWLSDALNHVIRKRFSRGDMPRKVNQQS